MPAVVIDVGHIMIEPNAAGQEIEVPIASTSSADPKISGVELKAQISSGGPVFEAVDFSTNLWNSFSHVASGGPWPTDPNLAAGNVSFTRGSEATGKGTVVRFTVDSTGIPAGSFELRLAGTGIGGTEVLQADGTAVPTVITNGTVQVRSAWQNPDNVSDVNGDGFISPVDILLGINRLNKHGSGKLPLPTGGEPPPYYDVDGDGEHTPVDILVVINCVNGGKCITTPVQIPAKTTPASSSGSNSGGSDPPQSGDDNTTKKPAEDPAPTAQPAPKDPGDLYPDPVEENERVEGRLADAVFAKTPTEELIELGLS